MSFLSGIGDAISDAADFVGDVAEAAVDVAADVVDVAGNVAERMVDGAIDSAKGTFDSFENFAKALAFATVLAPVPTLSTLFAPGLALAADAQGRVYVVSARGVQRVENGSLVTLAGDPHPNLLFGGAEGTADGPGTQARFTSAASVAVDAAGNLYIGDAEVIRRVTPEGFVTTVAGTRGSLGLRTGALPGSLGPVGRLAVGDDGVLVAVSGTALVKIRLP